MAKPLWPGVAAEGADCWRDGDNAAAGLGGWQKIGVEKCFQQICASL
ncbi:hypothetical protein C4K40_6268 [Pseudomonas sp. CMR5c]|nr:hypothetical protein C4K40_6268 [Pseudomonas sp. CMR5c]